MSSGFPVASSGGFGPHVEAVSHDNIPQASRGGGGGGGGTDNVIELVAGFKFDEKTYTLNAVLWKVKAETVKKADGTVDSREVKVFDTIEHTPGMDLL